MKPLSVSLAAPAGMERNPVDAPATDSCTSDDAFDLPAEQRRELERIVTASTSSQQVVRRARILLLRAAGWSRYQTALEVGVNLPVVQLWERRFASFGLAGLANARGQGAKSKITANKIKRLLKLTAEPAPPPEYRWTVQVMARQTGLTPSSVHRLWTAHGIKPHLGQRIPRSLPSPAPADFCEVIGLYMNPPHRTLAVCSDGRRFEGGAEVFGPAWTGCESKLVGTAKQSVTEEMVRLFGALGYLDGKIAGTTASGNSCGEWLQFHEKLRRQIPSWALVHLLVSNSSTAKDLEVRAWLKQHPRFRLRVTPTGFSWLHSVERFFRRVVAAIGEGVSFTGGCALADEIAAHLVRHDLSPPPFTWRVDPLLLERRVQEIRQGAGSNGRC